MAQISLSSVIKFSSYWSKHVGVRWQILLSIAALLLMTAWLRNEYGQDDSNLWLVMNLFIRLLQWTLIGLFVISLLSAFCVWIFFLQAVKNKSIRVEAKFGDGQKAEAGLVPLTITVVGPALRPLLGTIQ